MTLSTLATVTMPLVSRKGPCTPTLSMDSGRKTDAVQSGTKKEEEESAKLSGRQCQMSQLWERRKSIRMVTDLLLT